MSNWTRKKGIKSSNNAANIVVTRYTVSPETAKTIKRLAPIYGSQGRALQIATEMLIRMPDPPEPDIQELESKEGIRMSFRLHERTYEIIRELADDMYDGHPGPVIAACVKVLKMKRLR